MKKVNIGLLGLGNIGTGTYKVLEMNRETIQRSLGVEVEITSILEKDTTRDRGIVINPAKFTQDPKEIFEDSSIEIVIELLGGVEPASSLMISAMNHGKSVVTANKAAVAANFLKLIEIAEKNNVEFRYEASVGGGIPVLKVMTSVLRANEFSQVLGIVNGTTNYILTQMTDNKLPYETALTRAQELGFAEADPTADVEGIDAANKLTILTALAFGDYIPPEEIPTEGITKVTPEQIEDAKNRGNKIKLIAKVVKEGQEIKAVVGPMELPMDHPLCGVNNEFNAIYIMGNAVGELMFYGKGAGPLPTGSAVLGDVMDIIEWNKRGEKNK